MNLIHKLLKVFCSSSAKKQTQVSANKNMGTSNHFSKQSQQPPCQLKYKFSPKLLSKESPDLKNEEKTLQITLQTLQQTWGCLVGVMNPCKKPEVIVPKDVYRVEVGSGCQIEFRNLRKYSLDTLLVFWDRNQIKREQFSILLMINKKVVFYVEKHQQIQILIQEYLGISKSLKSANFSQSSSKKSTSIKYNEILFEYSVHQISEGFLLEVFKSQNQQVNKTDHKQQGTAPSFNRKKTCKINKQNQKLQFLSQTSITKPLHQNRLVNKQSLSNKQIIAVSSAQKNLEQKSSNDMDVQDHYMADYYKNNKNQYSEKQEQPVDQLLELYYFNHFALEEAQKDIQQQQENKQSKRIRSWSQNANIQKKQCLLDDQFFQRY